MGTKLQKRMRPVLARLLESMRKRVKVGVGVQGPGEGGKRSLGILAGNLGLVLPGAGKTLPLGFTKLSWILPPPPGSSSPQPGPSNGVAPLPRSALLIQLATARPRPIKARPLDWRVQSKDWPHAGRPAHELRYSIYRDLWERGFFLSAAGKFGGDFLVYPGEFVLGPLIATHFFTIPLHSAFFFSFFGFIFSASETMEGQETLGNPCSFEGQFSK